MIVDCEFRKWRDKPHWRFPVQLIGRDAYGTWLGASPPTPYTGPRGSGDWEHGFVVLIPDGDWWTASFNDERQPEVDVYVDICTPAEWHSRQHVSSIDLDLDVIRLRDGSVILDDEDEFEEHRVLYDYPADVVVQAIEASERLTNLVRSATEPFGKAGAERLARFLNRPYEE